MYHFNHNPLLYFSLMSQLRSESVFGFTCYFFLKHCWCYRITLSFSALIFAKVDIFWCKASVNHISYCTLAIKVLWLHFLTFFLWKLKIFFISKQRIKRTRREIVTLHGSIRRVIKMWAPTLQKNPYIY